MSSKAISKMVGADVGKTLESINMLPQSERMYKRAFKGPDIKADDAIKAAAAPSREMTRGEAFRYARMAAKAAGLDPSKQTFTHNGKTYNTRMAGEGASKPAAPAATRSAPPAASRSAAPAKPDVSARTKEFFKNLSMKPKADSSAATPAARKSPANAGRSEGFLSRFAKSDTGKSFAERQKKKYGYAKGGKIDGIAIRGKTRAPLKKGK